MKMNIGQTERAIRLVVGVVIVALGVVYQSWWGLIGLLPVGTALVGWCPPYALLGIDTSGGAAAKKS
jgi:Inner membrane protein YgaP-like, transmembrane domain